MGIGVVLFIDVLLTEVVSCSGIVVNVHSVQILHQINKVTPNGGFFLSPNIYEWCGIGVEREHRVCKLAVYIAFVQIAATNEETNVLAKVKEINHLAGRVLNV